MTEFQNDVIKIVKSALTKEKIDISEEFDWQSCLKLARKHQIIPIMFYGIQNSGLIPPDDVKKEFESFLFSAAAIDVNQKFEISEIEKAFDDHGIDYMPLKGSVLKFLYPSSEMRLMSDVDILIRTEQYDIIKPIMQSLGFSPVVESDHELSWGKSGILIELHKRLIPSYNKDYYAYFGDGWRLAKPSAPGKNRYDMSCEDNFVYLFTHFAKHYRDGGIGIRHILDIRIYLDKNPNIDTDYVQKELKSLLLYDFYLNIIQTLGVWFDGKDENEVTELITDYIFSSGSYGTANSRIISGALKLSKTSGSKNIKSKSALKVLFPSYKDMCAIYPVVKKSPLLLPVMWVVRGGRTVLFRRGKLKKQSNYIKLITEENVSAYENSLNFVGLDFNFKEK